MPTPIALCTFRKDLGWRVVGVSQSDHSHVGIFKLGSIKLLTIPKKMPTKPGLFCNPRKIACI